MLGSDQKKFQAKNKLRFCQGIPLVGNPPGVSEN
jgi:hypothetical protein